MNLRAMAEADNAFLIEDDVDGFGVPCTLTPNSGDLAPIPCVSMYTRIGVDIDPGTGMLVAGNKSAITIRTSRLGGRLPTEGWTVSTTDISGAVVTGRVPKSSVMADRTLGRTTVLFKVAD